MPPDNTHFHMCTIASTPRIPEHCIQYAMQVEWPRLTELTTAKTYVMSEKKDDDDDDAAGGGDGGVTMDKDSPLHMTWLFDRAAERAAEFGIAGVTYKLTQQVVKNIIPAIASTNALISAACVNEALKWRGDSALSLNNYFMFIGNAATGTHTMTSKYEANPTCRVCRPPLRLALPPTTTLQQLRDTLATQHQLDKVSISVNGAAVYMANLSSMFAASLEKPISSLFASGELLQVDSSDGARKVRVTFDADDA
jgi:ubiquitin-activating enzyme E1 C